MSSAFYASRASDELASSQFGGIPAAPSLFAGCTKQPIFGQRALVLSCDQREAQYLPCELRTAAVTFAASGKVPGLLTSGSLFHHRHAWQRSEHRAQNSGFSKQPDGAAIMARMPAPQFNVSIYSFPLFTSSLSSCPSTEGIACPLFDLIVFPSALSFRLSVPRLSPPSTRSSSFRSPSSLSSSVHPSALPSSPSLGVSVHAS